MDYGIIIISIFIILFYIIGKEISDYKWRLKPITQNFPFIYRGKELWYSRSVATTGFVFCKNSEDKWCVLANQRGNGTPDYQGYWNVPCGYLEYNVSGEENIIKEIQEECGITIPIEKVKFYGVNSSPKENKQNVSLRYTSVLEGITDDYKLSSENSEENEVSEIKWVLVEDVDNYDWAFNHLELIKQVFADIIK